MKQEIAFFINPHSGQGRSESLAQAARAELSGVSILSKSPNSAGELAELCRTLPSGHTRAAVIFGGDGTLNYALRGLIESEIPLYPYPSGTANDLASENGITGNPKQLSRLLRHGATTEIRVLQVNGIPFSTISGIGIGSKVCDEFNRMRGRFHWFQKLPKRFNCEVYSFLAAKTIFQNWGKGVQARLISDEFNEVVHTSVLMVCNQATLAGNLRVAPTGIRNTGNFTVIFQRPPPGFTTLKALAKMKFGVLDSSFCSFQTKHLRVESLDGSPLPVFGDGEILETSPVLNFGIHPKKIRVFRDRVPSNSC
jgi:diacylglycerol kinase family enzyme